MEANQLLTRGVVNSGIASLYFLNSIIDLVHKDSIFLAIICSVALVMSLYDIYAFYRASADLLKPKTNKEES